MGLNLGCVGALMCVFAGIEQHLPAAVLAVGDCLHSWLGCTLSGLGLSHCCVRSHDTWGGCGPGAWLWCPVTSLAAPSGPDPLCREIWKLGAPWGQLRFQHQWPVSR